MKRKSFILLLTLCVGMVSAQTRRPAIPRDAALEAKVEKTLSKMTLDEKVGQMLELNLDVMGRMTALNPKVDRSKIRQALQQYGRTDDEITKVLEEKGDGFVKAMWCGEEACEDEVKAKTGVGSRCIPFEQEQLSDRCVCCGKPAKHMVYWGKAY